MQQKPKQSQIQTKGKARGLFDVVNLGTPAIPSPIANLKKVSTSHIPFGDNNDFPQRVTELCRESATLGAILQSKAEFAAGDSYEVKGSINVENYLKHVNSRQNIIELAELVYMDYYMSGNAYIRVIRPVQSKILAEYSLEHVAQHKIRVSKKLDGFFYNNDWMTRNNDGLFINKFPFFKELEGGIYEEAMIHIYDYAPGFEFYGLPTYMGAMSYAKLEYLIGLYNNNQFDNQMLPSGILEVVTSNMEDEDAARFIRDIKAKYTNVEKGNNGKILVIAKDSEQNKANFTPISQEQEGSFKELKQICTETIVTACQWFPSLAGIATEGKLGSNQQLSQEFEIASRYVSRQQKKIIDVITKIVALTNSPENFTITFINNKPGNVSKLTEKVNSDQIVMFRDLLSAAIAEIDPIKKKAIINSFVILFGFTENEANSMVNGTDITSN
jgi:hypothetical protein